MESSGGDGHDGAHPDVKSGPFEPNHRPVDWEAEEDMIFALEEERNHVHYMLQHHCSRARRVPKTIELGDYFNCLASQPQTDMDSCYDIDTPLDLTVKENEEFAHKKPGGTARAHREEEPR